MIGSTFLIELTWDSICWESKRNKRKENWYTKYLVQKCLLEDLNKAHVCYLTNHRPTHDYVEMPITKLMIWIKYLFKIFKCRNFWFRIFVRTDTSQQKLV